jgi:epoxide hydrolase-like predicted phosphatase
MSISAVVFDLGGVVFDSPIALIREFEQKNGLPEHLIARIVGGYGGEDGLWQRLERGELLLPDFCAHFDADVKSAGHAISSSDMMRDLHERAALRPIMLEAIRRIRLSGLKVAALTNNWVVDEGHDERLEPLRLEFDVFIESCRVGMRKPDPKIFALVATRLGVPLENTAFLDDMGPNLKAARALGMTTFKVADPKEALGALGKAIGLELV